MALSQLVVECNEDIKSSVKKLVRYEKRVFSTITALQEVLGLFKEKSVKFERVTGVRDELIKVYKTFTGQLETTRNVVDDNLKDDDEDDIYYGLVKCGDILAVEYAKAQSLYEEAKPNPMSEREARKKKYTETRDAMLAQIQAKKAQLDNTQTELKQIEEQFNKMTLDNEEKPENVLNQGTDQGATPDLFNYNSTPLWNSSMNGAGDDILTNERVAERLQHQRLQDALIQKALLPNMTGETFDGDPLLYRSFIHSFEQSIMRITSDPATQVSHLVSRCSGDALNAIRNKVVNSKPEEALKSALAALEREFGGKETLVRRAR